MSDVLERDPHELFDEWLARAGESEVNDPNAAALATASADGVPTVRMVLLKTHDPGGFVFYTNFGSKKAHDLDENPHAAMCFHWKSLRWQVRVEGTVTRVSEAEADAYFASRDRGSRIGAYASRQTQPLPGRWALEQRVAKYAAKFGVGAIPRPEWWGGFRLAPQRLEFWKDMEYRLHRRWEYVRDGDGWKAGFLFP